MSPQKEAAMSDNQECAHSPGRAGGEGMSKEISDALAELKSAGDELTRAQERTAQARSTETGALNRVNRAQKRVDELISKLKQEAVRDTSWKQTRGVPAP